MKKYIVIGNPIAHSLSPLLHNYWIEKNKIKTRRYSGEKYHILKLITISKKNLFILPIFSIILSIIDKKSILPILK